ncbi:MAG TPA: proton-conducting transporter membrane subunit, partial [Thiolinea sp.]|nr:proton-conducting transporter membrane subunit [Thiolinea sp.]
MIEAIPLTGAAFPWLSLLILLLPLGGVIAACLAPREARWAALATAIGALLIALIIVVGFDSQQSGFQFVERSPWIPTLNIQYMLGIDGLSVLFLPFTALLFLGVILASWNAIQNLPRLFFPLILLLEMAMMGIFSALDTILFFLFWELSVLPIYFLISLWGIGPNRRYAGVKYTLFMLAGGVPLLLGFVVLALQNPEGISFDYTRLLHIAHTHNYQTAIFILLTLGFAVKLPLFPLHSWLPV